MEIAQTPASPFATTSRECVLRYLGLLRKNITGARPLSTPLPSHNQTVAEATESDIIEGLALEIYLDGHHEEWVVAPERFFKKADSPARIASPAR